jgi:hypothetical protein
MNTQINVSHVQIALEGRADALKGGKTGLLCTDVNKVIETIADKMKDMP